MPILLPLLCLMVRQAVVEGEAFKWIFHSVRCKTGAQEEEVGRKSPSYILWQHRESPLNLIMNDREYNGAVWKWWKLKELCLMLSKNVMYIFASVTCVVLRSLFSHTNLSHSPLNRQNIPSTCHTQTEQRFIPHCSVVGNVTENLVVKPLCEDRDSEAQGAVSERRNNGTVSQRVERFKDRRRWIFHTPTLIIPLLHLNLAALNAGRIWKASITCQFIFLFINRCYMYR